jgi:sigma-E factor negative regulatory protein RseA
MSEERDSQLSAMFDGELPDAECELVARRLTRDPVLRAQWSRYALIGAALRGEPVQSASASGTELSVAQDVRRQIGELPASAGMRSGRAGRALARWWQPIAGAGLAAGVAAVSVLWLQTRMPADVPLLAAATSAAPTPAAAAQPSGDVVVLGDPALPEIAATPRLARAPADGVVDAWAEERERALREPEIYTVPPAARGASLASAQFANYVVAHSEYSAALNRRSMLSALVSSEVLATPAPAAASPQNTRRNTPR